MFDVEKKKGNSQVTSGIHVPSVLTKSPFASSLPQGTDGVKWNLKLPVAEDISPRAVLANALEEAAQTDMERRKLQEYKESIATLYELEEHLREVKAQIKEMSFAKGPRDRQKLADLKGDAALL